MTFMDLLHEIRDRILGRHTGTITAKLTNMVSALEAHAERKDRKSTWQVARAIALKQASDFTKEEAEKAKKVAAKIRELVA